MTSGNKRWISRSLEAVLLAVEQDVGGVLGPKLPLEVLVLGDVELCDFIVIEEGPAVVVHPSVVLVVACVNVRAFVRNKPDQSVVFDLPLYGVVP